MNTTACPVCRSQGYLAAPELPGLYRCTNWKCRAEYFVTRNRCKECGDDIEVDYEYCPFHSYLGDDPPRPRREDYCRLCLEPVEEGTEYCVAHNRERNEEDF